MIHSSMLTVKQSQIKQYRNLIKVIDITDYSFDTAMEFLKGCYIVCISRGNKGVNGFYAVDPIHKKHVVCLNSKARALLHYYSLPELIDL